LVQGYQQRERQKNRTLILGNIVIENGATFEDLRELTDLSAPTLSSHLKALQRDGLIELKHDFSSDALRYVAVERKSQLLKLLRFFIEEQKSITKGYKAEIERLERAAQELEAALEPFGKLPKEIEEIWDELDRARMEANPLDRSRRRRSEH
jgi:DNA-binding transcriptional ArsR family regulator